MRDFRVRVDSMTHEVKRKEMQIKELQSRVETNDGCKYNTNSTFTTVESHTTSKTKKSYIEKLIFVFITQTAAIHAVYVLLRHFNFSRWFIRR